jgi:hypothetical protein
MPNNHPLENYFNLIEENGLQLLEEVFFDNDKFKENLILDYDNLGLDIPEIVWDEEQKVYVIQFKENKSTLSFNGYLTGKLRSYFLEFKRGIRQKRFSLLETDKILDYYKMIQKELYYLMEIIKPNVEIAVLNDFFIVKKHLELIDNYLSSYSKINVFPLVNESKENFKIHWLGNTNLLCGLFYDLSNNDNKLSNCYYKYDRQNLTKFIIANFTDKDGRELSWDTIYTDLDPQKPEKRGKQPIIKG